MIRVYKQNGADYQEHIFENEKEFIEKTIKFAEEEAIEQRTEVDAQMEAWGFKNIIDFEKYDDDGDLVDIKGHFEADFKTCETWWNKYFDSFGPWIVKTI